MCSVCCGNMNLARSSVEKSGLLLVKMCLGYILGNDFLSFLLD